MLRCCLFRYVKSLVYNYAIKSNLGMGLNHTSQVNFHTLIYLTETSVHNCGLLIQFRLLN